MNADSLTSEICVNITPLYTLRSLCVKVGTMAIKSYNVKGITSNEVMDHLDKFDEITFMSVNV